MKRRGVFARRALASLLCVAACGGTATTPTVPSPVTVAGEWVGTLAPGPTTLEFTLAQSADQLSGTWTMTGQQASENGRGTLAGRVSDSTVTFVLSWSPPSQCPLTVSATLDATGMKMTGGLNSIACNELFSTGDFSATRR